MAPAGAGNIPLQLVKANPCHRHGNHAKVTYIQRVATKGRRAEHKPAQPGNMGGKQIVQYQADYIFWKSGLTVRLGAHLTCQRWKVRFFV